MNEYQLADLNQKIKHLDNVIWEETLRSQHTLFHDESILLLASMKRSELQNRLDNLQKSERKEWMNW
jgi:hypothetical protein